VGVIHKLKPEVIKFILDNKQANPHLSCRSLVALVLEKLQVTVSKSSINAIFKENNLSMPVGRRQKQKKKFNMPALPVIENIKSIAPTEEAQKPPLNESVKPEKEESNLDEGLVKEAEVWAERLLQKEHERLEQERLSQQEQERKAEKDIVGEDLLSLQKIQEEEYARQKEAERLKLEEEARFIEEQEKIAQQEAQKKAEEERLVREEAQRKSEQERLAKEKAEAESREKEAERLKLEEESRLKEEQERLAREEELKAERERWARLSEEENNKKEMLKGPQVVKEEVKIDSLSTLSLPRECTGVVLLKAVDYLVKGSTQLSEAIQRRLGYPKEEVEALTQTLIFQDVVGDAPGALSSVTRNEISADKLSSYFTKMLELKTMKLDLSRLLANIFTESRGIKMHFIDGNVVYLDAQMHTLWPTPYTPHNFSATIMNVKDYINRYFFKDGNLILFMAPGYDIPTKEFFTLLLKFNSRHETADNLILYGRKLDELENIILNPEESHSLLFALWPWQFTAYRKVKRIGEFSLQHIDCAKKDLYLAEIEIELLQPTSMQSLSLKGCAIKLALEEKIRLVVLSADSTKSLASLADAYLCRWPNLDEGFHDFNRKIELFSCTGEAQQVFDYEELPIGASEPQDLKSIFTGFSEALDAYLRWHFMPSGYEKAGLNLTKERFYSQKAQLIQGKDKLEYTFALPPDFAYAKDLEYICRRLNERDIRAEGGQRICFESGFK